MHDDPVANVQRLKILIADDHPLIRAGIRTCFSERPQWHVCAEAGTGEAALRMAHIHRPDIVVLDFSLTDLNGLEVTRELCRRYPDIGVVIYSMHGEHQLIMDLLEAGARGWVSKNDDDGILMDAIFAVAGGRTYVRQPVDTRDITASAHSTDRLLRPLLTSRELEVVKLVAEGETNRSIAALLSLSIKTVDSHRTAAMRKLDVHTTAELVRYAIKKHLIRP